MPTAKRASADEHVHVRVDDYPLGLVSCGMKRRPVHSSQSRSAGQGRLLAWKQSTNRIETPKGRTNRPLVSTDSAMDVSSPRAQRRVCDQAAATRRGYALINLGEPAPSRPSSRRTRTIAVPAFLPKTYCRSYLFKTHYRSFLPARCQPGSIHIHNALHMISPPSDSSCPPEHPDHGLANEQSTHRSCSSRDILTGQPRFRIICCLASCQSQTYSGFTAC